MKPLCSPPVLLGLFLWALVWQRLGKAPPPLKERIWKTTRAEIEDEDLCINLEDEPT